MPYTLIGNQEWKVYLVMNDVGQWFLQFQIGGHYFTMPIDRKDGAAGEQFHNWIGDVKPSVISDAMDKLS